MHAFTGVLYAAQSRVSVPAALFLVRSTRLRVRAGGQFAPLVEDGQWWRLFRSVFLHGDAVHLLFNATAILVLGRLLEPWVGTARFVWWFAVSGVIASMGSHGVGMLQSDGASGGAFGLMGPVMVLGWRIRADLVEEDRSIFTRWLPGFLVLNLVLSILLPFVDAVGHVVGLAVGLLFGLAAKPTPPGRAITTAEAIGALLIGLIALFGPLWPT